MGAFNMKNYVKNVSRSVAYVAVESAKELNPTITEFAETNGDVLKEMYSAVRDFKKYIRQGKQTVLESEYTKIARETVHNFFDDLKTGNFYNKEREEKNVGGAFGIDLDDWDFDLDNIDVDFGDDEDYDDVLTMSGMDTVGQKIAKATGKASIASADYIVKANRASNKSMMAHNEILFGRLNTSLVGINTTLASIGKAIVEPSTAHYENSTKFYEFATNQYAEQTGYLKQIYEILNARFNPPKKTTSRSSNALSKVMGYGGVPDLREYGTAIKNNFKEMTSLITAMTSMLNMDGNGGMLRNMLSSPVASLMKMGTTSLTNKIIGKDLERFNKTLAGLFGSAILKINRKADKDPYSFTGMLANLLSLKPSSKRTIDTSRYEKGRVDWTGKADKALREVIPTQLALILSALTGKEAKVFNYETGKWVTYSGMQKSLSKDVKRISRNATSDIRTEFEKYYMDDAKLINPNINKNSKAFHTFRQDMDNFYHYLVMHNNQIPMSEKEWNNLEKKLTDLRLFVDKGPNKGTTGLMLHSNFVRIKSYYRRNYDNKKGYLNMQTNGALLNARNELGDFYTRQEESGNYSMLFNGSGLAASASHANKDNFLTFAIDDKGNNVFFYLQKFYSDLGRIADNTSGLGGSGGGRRSRRSKSKTTTPVNDYTVPTNAANNAANHARKFVDINDENADDNFKSNRKKEESKTWEEKIKDRIKEKNKLKKEKEWAEDVKDNFENKIKDNAIIKKMGKPGEILASLLAVPAHSVRQVLDSADNLMYSMVFGTQEGDENPGILAKIKQGFDDTFETIKTSAKNFMRDTFSPIATAIGDKIANMFGYKTFNDMKGSIFNGIKNSSFVKGVGENLKSAGRWVKNSVKDTIYETGDYFTGGKFSSGLKNLFGKVKSFGKKDETSQAAEGGFVTKSGMISVSEGELIIPSERNPYYNGRLNKAMQIAKEKSVANRWKALSRDAENYWGEYAKGGTAEEPRKNKSLYRKAKRAARRAKKAAKKMKESADDAAAAAKETYDDTMDDIRETEGYKKVSSAFDWAANTIKNGTLGVISRLFGKTVDENGDPIPEEKTKEKMSKTMKTIWGEIKQNAPSMAAGGIIGAGTSLLTGMVGGPLLGAAVGSAVGLAVKSEKFNEYLFGKQDKNGNYKGGFFGPRLSNFLKKNAPRIAKFGVTGGIAGLTGLVPGGPIAGLMAGAALGFVTESDDLRNYLFGEEGLLGKDTDKKIKKAFPKMALGAGVLALTGPFGLVGNAVLGSALGLVSETDRFKEAIYGVRDSNGQLQGGLLGIIREDVIDPMANYFKGGMKKFEDYMVKYIFDPIKNVLRPLNNMIGAGLNKIGDFIKGEFSDKISSPILKFLQTKFFKPISQRVGWLADKGLKLLATPGKIFGNTLNNIGTRLDRKAIIGGYSSLSAEDRALRATTDRKLRNTKYATKEYDKIAAGMNADDLSEAKDALSIYNSTVKGARIDKKKIRRDSLNRILADSEWGTTLKQDKRLTRAINDSVNTGDFSGVYEVVRQLDKQGKLNGKTDKLMRYLQEQEAKIKEIDNTDISSVTAKAEEAAKKLGINLEDYSNNASLRRLINADVRRKNAAYVADEESKETEDKEKSYYDKLMEAEEARHNKLMEPINAIKMAVFKIAGIDVSEEPSSEKTKETKNVSDVIKQASKEEEKSEETKIETDNAGNVIRYVKDAKGNWSPDVRDAATSKALADKKQEDEQRSKFYASFTGISGILNSLKDKIFGNSNNKKDDDKKGFLDKIFDKISDFDIGDKLSSLVTLLRSSGVGSAALGSLGLLFGGNLLNLLTKNHEYADKSGESKGFIGNAKQGFDNVQNIMTGHNPNLYSDDEYERATLSDRYLSQGVIKNSLLKGQTGNKLLNKVPFVGKSANSILKFTGNVRNKVVDKVADKVGTTKIGKAVKSKAADFVSTNAAMRQFGSAVSDKKAFKTTFKSFRDAGIDNAAQMAAETVGTGAAKSGMLSKIASMAQSAISKALSLLGVKGAETVAKEGAEELVEAAAKEGTEKVAKGFAKCAALPVQLGFIALAVQNGWEDAKSILGILEEPTIKERVLAAALNGINEAIPGIGGIVPTETIFTILLTLLDTVGIIDGSALMQKREDAKAIVNEYNAANNEQYSVREYVKNVLGEYTTQEKIGRGVKKIGAGIWEGTKKVGSTIKDLATGKKNLYDVAGSLGKGAFQLIKKGAGKLGGKATAVVDWVEEGFTALTKLTKDMYKNFSESEDSPITDAMKTQMDISDDNPLKGIIENIGSNVKIVTIPAILISKIGKGIKNKVIDPIISKIKAVGGAMYKTHYQAMEYLKNGDVVGLLKMDPPEEDPENPLGFLSNVINVAYKFQYALPTAFSWIGHKVGDVLGPILSQLPKVGSVIYSAHSKTSEFMKNGDLKGLLTMDSREGLEGPMSFIAGTTDLYLKANYFIPTAFSAIDTKIKDLFVQTAKNVDPVNLVKDLWEYRDSKKDISGLDKVIENNKSSGTGFMDTIDNVVTTVIGGIMKSIVKFVRPFYAIGHFVGDVKTTVSEGAKSVWDKAKSFAGNALNGIGNWVNDFAGSGSHVSQKDPRYAGMKFGSNTVGENGCGPAVAATVLRKYGKNANIIDMAEYAKAHGYVAGSSGVGTKAGYFKDVLSANGINSRYTDDQKSIKNAIGSGNPTILLGQDASNGSKHNSPFGPNPHYVVAQGMDRNGNVLINDPELNGPALYKKSILNKTKLGVITGGDSGLTNGDYIGKYVKKYESGNKGSEMISSGTGDHGGVSFGSYQFPSYKANVTTKGNLPEFWNKYYASQYPGVQPGDNSAFKSAWTTAVKANPKQFFNNEHAFVASQYYAPIANKLASNGVGDPTNYDRAAQEAAWSTAVQMGPTLAANIFKQAGVNNNMKPDEYITKLYDYKKNNVGTLFKSSSSAVQKSVANRYAEEKQMLLGLTGNKPIDPNTTNGATPTITSTNYATDATTSSSESGSSSSGGLSGFLDNILNTGFNKVFEKMGSRGSLYASMFGGNLFGSSGSTSTNDYTASSTTGATEFTNSKNTEQENKIVSAMSNMFGWLDYSQKKRNDFRPGGSSDCSATVQHVLKTAIGVDPGGDTGAQIESSKGKVVDTNIGNGPNEANLRPGDLLLYRRNNSSKTKGVGHVEMYMGDGTRAGHGGGKNSPYGLDPTGHGKGPFTTPLTADAANYIEAKRFTTNDATGTGSGLLMYDFTNMDHKPKNYSNNDVTTTATKQTIRTMRSNMNKNGGNSGLLNGDILKLFENAIKYLEMIANNTSYNVNMKQIVDILNSMAKVMNASKQSVNVSDESKKVALENDMNDIMSRLKRLAEIA